MAKEVSYEEGWWKTHSWFIPNENFGEGMVGHGNEEKTIGDDKSIDPNTMRNENQMEQLKVGSIGGADDDKIMSADHDGENEFGGVVQKRNGKGIDVGNEGDDGKGKKDHQPQNYDIRVSAERERRRKETKLFKDLHALLPQLPLKVAKATIVEEAMRTIESLEETCRSLEKQKLERLQGASSNTIMGPLAPSQSPVINTEESLLINKGALMMNLDTISNQSSNSFKTWASSNVILTMCGVDALISICSTKIPDLFTTICYILEMHNLDVICAQISSNHAKTIYMIRVRGNVPPELAGGFPYEEIYKKAVAQIIYALG